MFLSFVDEILIQEVQNNPILHNTKDTDYKNIMIKHSIWKEISTKIKKLVNNEIQ